MTDTKKIVIGILVIAIMVSAQWKWTNYIFERGRRKERLNIIVKALDENGKISNAPLLIFPPWTPERELNISSKNYMRGDLK